MESRQAYGWRGWLAVILLSIIAICSGWYGWGQVVYHAPTQHGAPAEKLPPTDVIYHALKSIDLGEAYDNIGREFRGNVALEVARFTGLIVHFIAVGLLIATLMDQSLIRMRAAGRRRHLVIIGDTQFADKLAILTRECVTHLRSRHEPVAQRGQLIRLPFEGLSARATGDAAIRKARGLLIATDNEADAADLGLEAQHLYPKTRITIKLNDRWLAHSLHEIEGAGQLRTFSESGVFSREIVRRHPPYLLAQDLSHSRVHALIIGEPEWQESLMAEIILSACTLSFGKPAFSFLSNAPAMFEERLRERYPELDKEADLAFYDSDALSHTKGFYFRMEDIARLGPVTALYCLHPDPSAVLSACLAFIDRAKRDERIQAPVFGLLGNSKVIPRPAAGSELKPLTLVPFGSHEDMARGSGLLAQEGELAEQTYHKAYLKFANGDGEAAKPWNDLKEEYRTSNRRAVAHIYAKLFESGFDLRSWMSRHDIWAELPSLNPTEQLYRSPDELTRLAMLEHDRWIADRRLNGWSYGPVRDNLRRLHPDIIPFNELTAEKQAYDSKFIELLAQVLKHKKDGMQRLRA